MKKETAIRQISNVVEKELKNETKSVKDYVKNLIYTTWQSLKADFMDVHNDSDNLKFAIEVNLYDERIYILDEARRETREQ